MTFRILALILLPALLLAAPPPRKKSVPASAASRKAKVMPLDPAVINNQQTADGVGPKVSGSAALRGQILLDRLHFSVGEIDASYGANMERAIGDYQQAQNLEKTGTLTPETWQRLNADPSPALVPFTLTDKELAGPFTPVPEDMMAKAKLPQLGYATPLEMLGEMFHTSPSVLQRLNPGKAFDKAGEQLLVPNVITATPPKVDRVEVSKAEFSLRAYDKENKLVARYPVSFGRDDKDPLPLGEWKINGVARNPDYKYNPQLFWDADVKHSKVTVPPGPNNPVGVVWIDLSKEHYGIHGTPEPSLVGKTRSHGCLRMTNWDATELAGMVAPAVKAVLKEQ